MPSHFDLLDSGRMKGKGPLDAYSVSRDAPHGKVRVCPSTFANAYDGASDQLNSLPITLYDAKVNLHIVPNPKVREV
jgi:hypothetical protein